MDFGQCLIRPFRNAKMECCGSSLASPKASRGISRVPSGYFGMPEGVLRWQPGFPQSVAKHFKGTIHFGMQKGMLRDQSGFPKALRGVSVRFGIPETSVAVVPWLPQRAARHVNIINLSGIKIKEKYNIWQSLGPGIFEF